MILLDAVRIFAFLVASPLIMRLKLDRARKLVSRPVSQGTPDEGRVARTIRLVDLMIRFGRPLVVSGCLSRGLTLYYFLRKLGVNVSLVFGAGRVDDRFAAHCWLERNSEPYLEKINPRTCFSPIYSFGNVR